MLPFEFLYSNFHTLDKKEEELVFARNGLLRIAFSSFKFYSKKEHKFENISKTEHKVFMELLIISEADKGNVIIIDRNEQNS